MKTLATLLLLTFGFLSFAQTGTTISNSFTHNGVSREYKLYVPASYDGTNEFPLVFNLHGYTSNMDQQIAYGDFRPIADTANFLVVHPNGTVDGGGNRFWNAFATPGVDDIGFLSILIDTINNGYNLNLNRVYSCGMSNGGYMSYELACQLGNRIAAVASVTGTMATSRMTACSAPKPTPIMQIHGTADPTVSYNGSAGNESIPDVVDYWVSQTNCNPTANITNVPDNDPNDGCTAEHYVYTGGDQGSTVELFKILGGGHTWPGAPVDIGVTNHDFDASIEIWRFFSQFTLDQFADVDGNSLVTEIKLFPNPSIGTVGIEIPYSANSVQLKVVDEIGRTILETEFSNGQKEVKILETGVYFFRLKLKDEVVTRKVVIN
jgi:polyhydroxybutyrate depolymerase